MNRSFAREHFVPACNGCGRCKARAQAKKKKEAKTTAAKEQKA